MYQQASLSRPNNNQRVEKLNSNCQMLDSYKSRFLIAYESLNQCASHIHT